MTQKQFDAWVIKGFEGIVKLIKDHFVIKEEHIETLKTIIQLLGVLTVPQLDSESEVEQDLLFQSLKTLAKLIQFRCQQTQKGPDIADCRRLADCRQLLINAVLFKD